MKTRIEKSCDAVQRAIDRELPSLDPPERRVLLAAIGVNMRQRLAEFDLRALANRGIPLPVELPSQLGIDEHAIATAEGEGMPAEPTFEPGTGVLAVKPQDLVHADGPTGPTFSINAPVEGPLQAAGLAE